MKEFTVKFKPQNRAVKVPQGTDILTAAVKAGISLSSSCGGEGVCGKCKVIVVKGEIRTEASGLLTEAEIKKKTALACEAIVESDLEIEVPAGSIETHGEPSHEAEEFSKGVILKREAAFKRVPLIEKFYMELSEPTQDDNAGDLDRIYREIESKHGGNFITTKLSNVRLLSDILRESDFKVTAVIAHKDGVTEIMAIEPGDTTKENFAFAFDIGTTTIAGQLIDMNSGKVLGSRIAYNSQAKFGSDVISRIIHGSNPKGLDELNGLAVSNMNEMIEELSSENKIDVSKAYSVTCAGNMSMMHFLFKVDPTHIRKAPYIPTTTTFSPVNASEAGIRINPRGAVYSIPGVTTYIGGDIVSGLLASGVFEADDISILIDIGTNGEIVVGNREWMIGAAASAGPAFEGSGLSCGMKAVSGAIDKVKIAKSLDVKVETIGNAKPAGLCGSAYIDLLNEMLKAGVIERDGKINRKIRSDRVRKGETTYEFVVSPKRENASGKDIVINEDDIDNLKRAKGAIYSAIIALLKKVDKRMEDAKKIYIAGGFGNYIGIDSAVSIGLLPDLPRNVYEYIGNSSLAGARMSLLSRDAYELTKNIAKNITYVDLSSEPHYMDEYIASLFFPHTDLGRFPSARS